MPPAPHPTRDHAPDNHPSLPRYLADKRHVLAAGMVVAAAGSALLLLPALGSVPQRLAKGCGGWVALGAAFELLSAAGFVIAFELTYGDGRRRGTSSRVGLRVLAMATALPAGSLVAPVVAAWTTRARRGPVARPALAFVLLTNVPDLLALAAVGAAAWVGLLAGPHSVVLTLVPAASAALLLAAGASLPLWLRTRPARPRRALARWLWHASQELRQAASAVRALLEPREWRLIGPLAYYAFDNAVLWASFRALGHSPPLEVIAMAYVIGQVGSLLPLPGGVGGIEAGLLGTLVLYGSAPAPAASAVLLYRAISLAVPLALGAGACIRRRPSAPGQASGRRGSGLRSDHRETEESEIRG
jgi:uncharacterized membrane protein YbhN (UPF0104 family)